MVLLLLLLLLLLTLAHLLWGSYVDLMGILWLLRTLQRIRLAV
jgi:hypothetical protein